VLSRAFGVKTNMDLLMLRRWSSVALALLLTAVPAAAADGSVPGLRLSPGFEITEFAGDQLANDIWGLTIDPRGRVVVSGPGYIRILIDDHGRGRADRAIDLADVREGAQGLLWEGSYLYFTADGGLRRYHIGRDGDHADGPAELIRAMHTGGEHCAHAIRRGPDGWLYLLCGNSTGIDGRCAQLPTSPIRQPTAGCVLRFTPDLRRSEIVADGYRNAYDMDFSSDGDLFTFDSDNERCVSLPWYEPTRFYHVQPGGHYGWQSPQHGEWWRQPPYFADVVAPVATFGRGSPTGVACYRHMQFPPHYRGGFFLADWTFGRVYFVRLRRSGSTYTARQETFLEALGDSGFAPTALAVHPRTGDLFVAIGGRGTRGAVYRIRYPAGMKSLDPAAVARLQPKPRSLDWSPDRQRAWLRQAMTPDARSRREALDALYRHREHVPADELTSVIRACWNDPDRYVRQAVARLIADLPEAERRALAAQARSPLQHITLGLGTYETDADKVRDRAVGLVADTHLSTDTRLQAVRVLQLALGDLTSPKARGIVWEGYSLRRPPRVVPAAVFRALRSALPSGDAYLDRELSRTLAALHDDDPDTPTKIGDRLTSTSDPVDDTHFLIVLACLRGRFPPALVRRTARAFLSLDRKLAERHDNRDNNWPFRITETYRELVGKAPDLPAAMLADPAFGRPDHALFARAPGFDRRRAAEIFLARAGREEGYAWTPEVVEVVGSLPDERSLPVLRNLWGKAGLDEAILPLLARRPLTADRDKFVTGLNSPQLQNVRLSLDALQTLPGRHHASEVLALIRCLRRLPAGRPGEDLRRGIGKALAQWTGQAGLGTDGRAWSAWFARAHPDLATRLGDDGAALARWKQRLAALDWSAGEAHRGRDVFVRATCASCHSGAQALGPDLRGVARRFSRDDLLTAILQPSRDISPRYRTLMITTASGKTYQGLVIYESTDGLMLQTGPTTTVRVRGSDIESRQFTDVSMMPAGLLDTLADRDIADLLAYLKGLGAESMAVWGKTRGPGKVDRPPPAR
jgi:putative heme-binding domain-containing protein